ncbi:hypothetical protein B0H13DRAFT_1924811 [Mycena leptocephala]|nr:hypothetical protein B0H13DRAFT_1924811 [Mycena leptocephala]
MNNEFTEDKQAESRAKSAKQRQTLWEQWENGQTKTNITPPPPHRVRIALDSNNRIGRIYRASLRHRHGDAEFHAGSRHECTIAALIDDGDCDPRLSGIGILRQSSAARPRVRSEFDEDPAEGENYPGSAYPFPVNQTLKFIVESRKVKDTVPDSIDSQGPAGFALDIVEMPPLAWLEADGWPHRCPCSSGSIREGVTFKCWVRMGSLSWDLWDIAIRFHQRRFNSEINRVLSEMNPAAVPPLNGGVRINKQNSHDRSAMIQARIERAAPAEFFL